jgi:hypothetical protein
MQTPLEEVQNEIEEWSITNSQFITFIGPDVDSFEMVLEAGTDERYMWAIGFDCDWKPMYVRSPLESGVLSEWVNRMNTFIQRQRNITLKLILMEARKSLALMWKIDITPTPAPTTQSTAPQPIAGLNPDFKKNLSDTILKQQQNPFTYSENSEEDTTEKPPEVIDKQYIESLILNNQGVLKLIEIKENPNKISLTIGDPPMGFEIDCNEEWVIQSITSEDQHLSALVPILKQYIDIQHPNFPSFWKHLNLILKDKGKTIDEIKEALERAPEILEEEAEKEEEYIDPTADDWEKIIFPTIHQYLNDNNTPIWQIEEWIRLIRREFEKCTGDDYSSCVNYVLDTGIFEYDLPVTIRKFFKRKQRRNRFIPPSRFANVPHGASEAAKRLMIQQAELITSRDTTGQGYKATPIRNNPFHWNIIMFDFDPSSAIYQQLLNYTITTDENNSYDSGFVKPVDVRFEIKFPINYPNGSPLFRLISPRFINMDESLFDFDFSNASMSKISEEEVEGEGEQEGDNIDNIETVDNVDNIDNMDSEKEESQGTGTGTITNITRPELDPNVQSTSISTFKPHHLSISMKLEKENWKTLGKLPRFIQNLRLNLMQSMSIQIDMNSSRNGIPTDGSFWQEFTCEVLTYLGLPESEVGGKIYLPSSALDELMGSDRYAGLGGYGGYSYNAYGLRTSNRNSPMIFEISSQSGIRSFCGVMEFIAPPNTVGIPSWLMEHLGINRGQKVQIRKVQLPKGIFVQLQPHSSDFTVETDVKATLEWVLRRFVALSVGDTIQIEHDGKVLKYNVLKCTPDRAIAITDQDVSVDIVSPLDGSEIPKPAVTSEPEPLEEDNEEKEKKEKVSHEPVTVGTMADEGQQGVHFEICKNCFQKVPIAQYAMHDLRCARINWYCVPCNMVVLKTDKQKHEEEFHSIYTCEWCGESMEKRLINDHKKNECSRRIVPCRFCKMTMQYHKKYVHESSCGAVTEVCPKCSTRFPRSDMEIHEKSCSGNPTVPTAPVKISPYSPRNNYNSYYNYKSNANQDKDIMLCEKCQQAFNNFEELQIHVLTDHYMDDQIEEEKKDNETEKSEETTTTPPDSNTNTNTSHNENATHDHQVTHTESNTTTHTNNNESLKESEGNDDQMDLKSSEGVSADHKMKDVLKESEGNGDQTMKDV